MAMMGWANDDGTGHAARLAGEYVNIRPLIGVGSLLVFSTVHSYCTLRTCPVPELLRQPCRILPCRQPCSRPDAPMSPDDGRPGSASTSCDMATLRPAPS